MPAYIVRPYGEKALKELKELGIDPDEVRRIWEEEDVPDIYHLGNFTAVDLQFLDHRILTIVSKDIVVVLYEDDPRLIRWIRNVMKKRRKFLERSKDFLYHAISMELDILNDYILELHKEITRYEKEILKSLRSENEEIILNLYELITKLLDVRRELTYFYRMLVKLRKILSPEEIEELRSSIQESVSLINLSLSTARSLLDVHDKVLSMELNLLIKRLTAISIILAVITIITGIYGMNFRYLPLAEHPLGFWILNGLMVALFFLMWWWFKRIGWM